MSWAAHAIDELREGRRVVVRPQGHSMQPKVLSGARVTLDPIDDPATLKRGEVVLVSVGRQVYLHLISATDVNRVQISNNRGRVNAWVSRSAVHGRAIEINNTAHG